MKNNLSTLSILHYVYGGLICLIGAAVLVLLLSLGNLFQSDWFLRNAEEAPPAIVGALMSVIGWSVFVFLEAKGIANIISGNLLAKARGRVFRHMRVAEGSLDGRGLLAAQVSLALAHTHQLAGAGVAEALGR